MKTDVLMIGDWVTNSINNKYYKVSSLTSDVELEGDRFIFYCPCDDIEPISLTPEILEKNFEPLDMEGEYFGFYDEYFEVEVSVYTDGIWEVKIDEIEMGGVRSWRMYVSYVHELQHTLRLCNIDKEIIL